VKGYSIYYWWDRNIVIRYSLPVDYEFEIDEEKKDKHAAICKECIAKHQPSICTCSCDKCIDGKIVKTAFSSMELLLTQIENGLELFEDMLIMITSLAHSAGILCEKCEAELD